MEDMEEKQLKILIDVRNITEGSWKRGIGEVLRNFVYSLKETPILTNKKATYCELSFLYSDSAVWHKIKQLTNITRGLKLKELVTTKNYFDVYHQLDPMTIIPGVEFLPKEIKHASKIRTATFYDAIPALFPDNGMSTWGEPVQDEYSKRLCFDDFHCIFAISKEAKAQLGFFSDKPNRIKAVSIGVDRTPFVDFSIDEHIPKNPLVDRIFKNRKNYILTIGGAEPHKGLSLLKEAFFSAKSRCPDLLYVLAGDDKTSWRRHLNIESLPGVLSLGQLRNDELKMLIKNALCVCMPSHIEGFGLPAWEAIANDTPAVVSNIPVFEDLKKASPELVHLVNQNICDWSHKLVELYASKNNVKASSKSQSSTEVKNLPTWGCLVKDYLTCWKELLVLNK